MELSGVLTCCHIPQTQLPLSPIAIPPPNLPVPPTQASTQLPSVLVLSNVNFFLFVFARNTITESFQKRWKLRWVECQMSLFSTSRPASHASLCTSTQPWKSAKRKQSSSNTTTWAQSHRLRRTVSAQRACVGNEADACSLFKWAFGRAVPCFFCGDRVVAFASIRRFPRTTMTRPNPPRGSVGDERIFAAKLPCRWQRREKERDCVWAYVCVCVCVYESARVCACIYWSVDVLSRKADNMYLLVCGLTDNMYLLVCGLLSSKADNILK